VEPERERRDDSEVSAPAADSPEEVGIDIRRSSPNLAVRADDLGRDDVVAREPALAAEPPVPAAEREPGDAGLRDDSARGGQPEGLSLPVGVSPQGSALHARDPRLRIDVYAPHEREVDDHPTVRAREPGDRVSPTTNGDLDSILAREVDGVDDVCGSRATCDQARTIGVHRVERDAGILVTGVGRRERLTPELHPEL